MLFNSIDFLIFLPCVVAIYAILPVRMRWMLLLAASYFFYGFWKVEYLGLIAFSTVVDFFVARQLGKSERADQRKLLLIISLCSNLGLLFTFKYFNWFLDGVLFPIGILSEGTLNAIQSHWKLILPVGISFYTFQTMGYTIDVYYRKVKPERNLAKFALFVSFFPQLVAGPIERFAHLHTQLFKGSKITYDNFKHGARLALYGLFIKMCVADNISPMVDQVFGAIESASVGQRLLGMSLFAIQIFSDFHGYSLIAIGTARIFDIHLMDNFKSPYLSQSIREFWSRWHISLSTWFRDYLYIPLGGNRSGQLRLMVNILIVFIVSGFWHGANWTFIAWGALHGLGYLIEQRSWNSAAATRSIPGLFRWFITLAIVVVAWVFFRSASIADAFSFLSFSPVNKNLELDIHHLGIGFALLFLWSDVVFGRVGFHQWLEGKSTFYRWVVYALLIYFIAGFAGTVNHPFIYFQF